MSRKEEFWNRSQNIPWPVPGKDGVPAGLIARGSILFHHSLSIEMTSFLIQGVSALFVLVCECRAQRAAKVFHCKKLAARSQALSTDADNYLNSQTKMRTREILPGGRSPERTCHRFANFNATHVARVGRSTIQHPARPTTCVTRLFSPGDRPPGERNSSAVFVCVVRPCPRQSSAAGG